MAEEDNKSSKKRLSTSAEEDEPPTKKRVPAGAESSDNNAWDVEECRGDHESVEHWELRKQFLLQNMDRGYTKSRLICLSQVFANMEFLGCRYPEETMELVHELSLGIVEEYREKQKSRLQRTFVKASAAAERKTKGNNFGNSTVHKTSKRPITFLPATSTRSEVPHNGKQNQLVQMRSSQYPDLQSMILLIYTYNNGENAVSIIHRSCASVNIPIAAECSGTLENYMCTYRIGSHLTVHSNEGHQSKESAKLEAAKFAFKELQKCCYTFVTKMKVLPESHGHEIGKEDVDKKEDATSAMKPISGDNIGSKLLKLMGWSGGGLGKNQQGIHEAISVDGVVGKSRLGLGNASGVSFNRKITDLLEQHRKIGFPYDLKFSSDFSKDERKDIHIIAQRIGLKSKSFGKDEDRYIVVSEKISRKGLLENTIAKGGETDKYCVIPPGGDTENILEYI